MATNHGLAALLNLALPGAGHMYAGRVGSGLWFAAIAAYGVYFDLWAIYLGAGTGAFVTGLIDARKARSAAAWFALLLGGASGCTEHNPDFIPQSQRAFYDFDAGRYDDEAARRAALGDGGAVEVDAAKAPEDMVRPPSPPDLTPPADLTPYVCAKMFAACVSDRPKPEQLCCAGTSCDPDNVCRKARGAACVDNSECSARYSELQKKWVRDQCYKGVCLGYVDSPCADQSECAPGFRCVADPPRGSYCH